MKRVVLITGATAGFGKATAYKFAQNGDNIILTGRREERLLEIKKDLEKKFSIKAYTMCFDVQDKVAVQALFAALEEPWKNIDILINNAGLALGLSGIDDGNVDQWDTMIDTNVKGLLYVTRAVLPNMKKRKSGHIINIGSIAAKEVYKNGNVYCSTKAAVDSLSQSMRIEMLPYNIKVTAIHPGAADTEFSMVRFQGDKLKADSVYKGYHPLYAEDIADVVFYTASLPAHVCINDLVVMPTAQASPHYYNRD